MIFLRDGASVIDFDSSHFYATCPACLHTTGQQAVRFGVPFGRTGSALEVACAQCGYQIAVMKPANAEA